MLWFVLSRLIGSFIPKSGCRSLLSISDYFRRVACRDIPAGRKSQRSSGDKNGCLALVVPAFFTVLEAEIIDWLIAV